MLTRRAFLLSSAVAASTVATAGALRLALLGRGSRPSLWTGVGFAQGRRHGVSDLLGASQRVLAADFQPHSVLSYPDGLLAVPKSGHAVQMLADNLPKEEAMSFAPAGRTFSGHGLYRPETDEVLLSTYGNHDEVGFLDAYDARTLQHRRSLGSGGFGPHEVHSLAAIGEPDLVAVANGSVRHGTNIAVVHVGTGRVEGLIAGLDPVQRIRHMQVLPDGTVIVASWPSIDAIAYSGNGNSDPSRLAPQMLRAQLRSSKHLEEVPLALPPPKHDANYQMLSVTRDWSGQFCAMTLPACEVVILYDIQGDRVTLVPVPGQPFGVAPALARQGVVAAGFVVTLMEPATLLELSPSGEILAQRSYLYPDSQFGPHLTHTGGVGDA